MSVKGGIEKCREAGISNFKYRRQTKTRCKRQTHMKA